MVKIYDIYTFVVLKIQSSKIALASLKLSTVFVRVELNVPLLDEYDSKHALK
jgi:hypothetical protein